MKISISNKLALALTLTLTMSTAFAKNEYPIPFDCEVTSIRDSIAQKIYDTLSVSEEHNRHPRPPKPNLDWLSKGDRFEIILDGPEKGSTDLTLESLRLNLNIRENICDVGIVESTMKLPRVRTYEENKKLTLDGKSVSYSDQFGGSSMTFKVDGNILTGKMILNNIEGKFSKDSCKTAYPAVIVKYSCTKR